MSAEARKRKLLLSKLSPPGAGPHLVLRNGIANRVFNAEGTRLVLVRGPAGFGKTTAMIQLFARYESEGTACAWLTLDDGDNELSRFLAYLDAALAGVLNGSAQADVSADEEPIIELIDRVSRHRGPFALFFDEFEKIQNPGVSDLLVQLLSRLPAGAQLVIGSRSVPDIGLARLRARGQLVEIDPSLLRFSSEEARDFLGEQRRLALQPEQVELLYRRTEGWIAALWLASVALQQRNNADAFIHGFAGSNTAIADYLTEDVFSALDADLREFLLKTSLLDELSVPLCDAVCGETGSRERFEQIEKANLFLMPLDEERSLFRYHSLFVDFLRAELKRRHPEWLAPVHRAAAQAYLQQNRPIPAITHAVASGDTAFSLPLLEQHLDSLIRDGRMRPILSWFDALPREALLSRPAMLQAYALAVTFTRGSLESLGLIESFESQLSETDPARQNFDAIRPLLLGMADRVEEASDYAERQVRQPVERSAYKQAWIFQTLANCSMILGRYADARQYADQARQAPSGRHSNFQLVLAESVDGAIDLMQGRLRQATVRLRAVSGMAANSAQRSERRNVFSGVLLAECLYEAGDSERAERLLSVLVPLTKDLQLPDRLISAHVLLARIVGDRGDEDRALELLEDLEQAGHRLSSRRIVASSRIERSRHFLQRGNAAAASEQIETSGDAAFWTQIEQRSYVAHDVDTYSIARFRWMIRTTAAAQAVPLIKEAIETADAAQRNRRALKLRILLAEALHASDERRSALRMIWRAVEMAAAEGFTRTLLEEGAGVAALLQDFMHSRRDDPEVASSSSSVEQFCLQLQPQRVNEGPVATIPGAAGQLETLTRKEIQVLELLAQGYSNNAMAAKLFVSETTVRTHLRSINVKLQASSRTQAIVIARRLNIIR